MAISPIFSRVYDPSSRRIDWRALTTAKNLRTLGVASAAERRALQRLAASVGAFGARVATVQGRGVPTAPKVPRVGAYGVRPWKPRKVYPPGATCRSCKQPLPHTRAMMYRHTVAHFRRNAAFAGWNRKDAAARAAVVAPSHAAYARNVMDRRVAEFQRWCPAIAPRLTRAEIEQIVLDYRASYETRFYNYLRRHYPTIWGPMNLGGGHPVTRPLRRRTPPP